MTPEELESAWARLPPPGSSDGISGRRVGGLPADRPVYLAIDGRQRRHLLIQVPDDTAPVSQRDTRSLEIATARFQVGSNPEALYVDLICTDSAQHPTFSAIAQDLIRSFRRSSDPLRDSIVSALARWRAFWAVRAGGMSRDDALGLFGELWFMRQWVGTVNAKVISHWQSTVHARHDFQWPEVSVEVKTAATQVVGAPVHRITSLEQLADPEQGQLYLFSLQVCDDALAGNTLHKLVALITEDIQTDFQALGEFNDRLAVRGYSPADQQAPARPLRILAERLYHVTGDFPRLTRKFFQPAGIPTGIHGMQYELDVSACERWLAATKPGEAQKIPGWISASTDDT